MSFSVNTNLLSLNAQRNLRKTQNPLQQAMERLSSGLRINSAKDDAAGLAIATRMSRQITGLTVAGRNANDGLSFLQTAEGAMDEMVNSLQRIYELAEQSSSYNSSTDRASMDLEVQELISELNRIVTQTRYGGERFLNRSFSATFQVGVEVNETISVSTNNMAPNAFGVQATRNDFTEISTNRTSIASSIARIIRAEGLSNNASLQGTDLGDAILGSNITNNSQTVIDRINTYTGETNITAFSFGNAYVGTADTANASAGMVVNSGYLTINGVAVGSTAAAGVGDTQTALASVMADAINNKTGETGVYAILLASADLTIAGLHSASIALVNTTGAAISVAVATANAGTASEAAAFFGTSGGTISAGQNGQIVFSAPLNTSTVTTNGATESIATGLGTSASIALSYSKSVNELDVQTVGASILANLAVEQGLDTIISEKAQLGATMNRLESTIENLENVRENIYAARSRIMDADFAAETANLTRTMILQQAGISVLAQANTVPQNVLALLQG